MTQRDIDLALDIVRETLPHLFGPAGYTILRKPSELPARLPLLYAQLTSA